MDNNNTNPTTTSTTDHSNQVHSYTPPTNTTTTGQAQAAEPVQGQPVVNNAPPAGKSNKNTVLIIVGVVVAGLFLCCCAGAMLTLSSWDTTDDANSSANNDNENKNTPTPTKTDTPSPTASTSPFPSSTLSPTGSPSPLPSPTSTPLPSGMLLYTNNQVGIKFYHLKEYRITENVKNNGKDLQIIVSRPQVSAQLEIHIKSGTGSGGLCTPLTKQYDIFTLKNGRKVVKVPTPDDELIKFYSYRDPGATGASKYGYQCESTFPVEVKSLDASSNSVYVTVEEKFVFDKYQQADLDEVIKSIESM